ncbi:MAG: ABC-2 family transporter protein [Alphaproteobacteria bacterium]
MIVTERHSGPGPLSLAGYIAHLMRLAVRTSTRDLRVFLVMNSLMLIQNFIMFMVWFIFFSHFSSLRGWELGDLATLYGMAASSFGLAFLIGGGTLDVGRTILNGELDSHLCTPRHPLLALVFRESREAGLGDVATAFAMWFLVAGYSVSDLTWLIPMMIFGAMIMQATAITVHALPFFLPLGSGMPDRIMEAFILVSTYPHNGFSPAAKILTLTLFPAGFIAFVPVEAMRTQNLGLLLAMGGAACGYLALSVAIFNRGLRHYTSGNRMIEMR